MIELGYFVLGFIITFIGGLYLVYWDEIFKLYDEDE